MLCIIGVRPLRLCEFSFRVSYILYTCFLPCYCIIDYHILNVCINVSFSLSLSALFSCVEKKPLPHGHCKVHLSPLRKPPSRPLRLLPPLLPHPRTEEGQRSPRQRGLGVCVPLDGRGREVRGQPVAADVGYGRGVGLLLARSQTQHKTCPLLTL